MKFFVTTCQRNKNLLKDFSTLFEMFLPKTTFHFDIAYDGEAKSEQLVRLLNYVNEEYLILLEEDFYFVHSVDMNLLKEIFRFCVQSEVDRFSLQSKNAHSYTDWIKTEHKVGQYPIYQTVLEVQVPFSLEASIWKKSFLLEQIEMLVAERGIGQDDGQIEMKISDRLREENTPTKIYALDLLVMDYRDMTRGGQMEIELKHNPLRLVVEPGNELALNPWGGNARELILCL